VLGAEKADFCYQICHFVAFFFLKKKTPQKRNLLLFVTVNLELAKEKTKEGEEDVLSDCKIRVGG